MNIRNLSKALCRAKTRSDERCKRIGNLKNGRCYLHGSKSTGPRTEEGRVSTYILLQESSPVPIVVNMASHECTHLKLLTLECVHRITSRVMTLS